MTIQFEWNTFREDDCEWDALFVKVDDGPWYLAQQKYGTENQEYIEKFIRESNVDGNTNGSYISVWEKISQVVCKFLPWNWYN
jgi:hypothetical protein